MNWKIILAILLLTACTGTSKSTNPEYRTGTQGLYLSFFPNQPPARIYQDQDVNVVLKLENKGASNLGNPGDRIYLSGFEPTIITNIPTTGIQVPKLEGKGPFRSSGDSDQVVFRGILRASALRNVDKYTPRLLATACYGYETIAQGNICLDPDPFSPSATPKVCTPSTISLGSQGAPVAVSQVQVQPSPGKARFTITVSNSGGGEVFKSGAQYLSMCSPYVDPGLNVFDDLDSVLVEDVRVGDTSIKSSCRPLSQGHLRLQGNSGSLFCELSSIRGTAAYVTPITITLRYGYKSSITKDITIVRTD